MLIYCSL